MLKLPVRRHSITLKKMKIFLLALVVVVIVVLFINDRANRPITRADTTNKASMMQNAMCQADNRCLFLSFLFFLLSSIVVSASNNKRIVDIRGAFNESGYIGKMSKVCFHQIDYRSILLSRKSPNLNRINS